MKYFETTDRRLEQFLEQFLFVHRIRFSHQRKDDCRRNVWAYPISPHLRRVVREYRRLPKL